MAGIFFARSQKTEIKNTEMNSSLESCSALTTKVHSTTILVFTFYQRNSVFEIFSLMSKIALQMMKCPRCEKDNPTEAIYCGECGAGLINNNGKPTPPINESGETPIELSQVEKVSQNKSLFAEKRNFEEREIPKGVHAVLTIERGSAVGTEFYLTAEDSYIGRWDADNGIFPDIDLDIYDPEAKVSRRHAKIIKEGENYYIEDLGSTNGTFINRGKRLVPGVRQKLEDGDEIIVGKTFLRFRICKR
ncbi:MAG: hypothetical protein KatS3mg006_0929 [Pyrinomonadaceae bacterium]|jgi:serine/threonine-protein kinase|nr:MAG: hypothetical protein KatS3mg006_0929 [Pyrinomonadaceae bacterium]